MLQFLCAPEHEQGHEHHQQHDHARGQPQPIGNGEASQVGTVPELLKAADGFAKEENAKQRAQGEEDTVQFERGGGNQRCAGAEAANDEAKAHDQAADNAGPEVGGVDPDQVVVQPAKASRQEDKDHSHDNGGEHDLKHRLVFEIELSRQLFGVAKAGYLQDVAKGKANEQVNGVCAPFTQEIGEW